MDSRYNKYLRLAENTYFKRLGKVVKIVGLTIESVGPDAKLNDLCRIIIDENADTVVMAEVVGFRDKRLLLMPYESVEGIGVGCIVENTGHPLSVPVGNELLGHTLDGIGRPTDIDKLETPYEYPVDAQPPDPMSRKIISEVLPLGVKAVDGLITVGKGQRIGIFAGSGVGKSTLLGMFARNTKADINVIALIGERGREVREFVERDLGEEGMKRSIVVVATSDKPALIRKKAAMTATSIAAEQRAKALEKAAQVRKARKELKENIKSGKTDPASVLKTRKDDPLVSKMKVKEFLQAIPGIGGAKADKIMHDANIPGNRRLGGLGIRQVEALLEYLS